jgi:hypothetical protein
MHKADRLLATANALLVKAEVEQKTLARWSEAGRAFERAASVYRQASLGLLARHSFEQGRLCFEAGGDADAAQRCGNNVKVIPTYWEASPDE